MGQAGSLEPAKDTARAGGCARKYQSKWDAGVPLEPNKGWKRGLGLAWPRAKPASDRLTAACGLWPCEAGYARRAKERQLSTLSLAPFLHTLSVSGFSQPSHTGSLYPLLSPVGVAALSELIAQVKSQQHLVSSGGGSLCSRLFCLCVPPLQHTRARTHTHTHTHTCVYTQSSVSVAAVGDIFSLIALSLLRDRSFHHLLFLSPHPLSLSRRSPLAPTRRPERTRRTS